MQNRTKKWLKRAGIAAAGIGLIIGVGVWNAGQSNADTAAVAAAVKPDCDHPPTTWPLCNRSVGAGQVVDNSLPAYKKLVKGSISEDLFNKAIQDKLNKIGTQGPKGDKGDKGDPGVSALHADEPYGKNLPGQDSSATTIPAGKTVVVWTSCAAGESALSGGYRIGDLSQESFGTGDTIAYPKLQVIASEPAFYKGGVLVNGAEAAPVNENLSFRPNAWAVTVHNADTEASYARAAVVCAKVS
jgi:hypothetical protein